MRAMNLREMIYQRAFRKSQLEASWTEDNGQLGVKSKYVKLRKLKRSSPDRNNVIGDHVEDDNRNGIHSNRNFSRLIFTKLSKKSCMSLHPLPAHAYQCTNNDSLPEAETSQKATRKASVNLHIPTSTGKGKAKEDLLPYELTSELMAIRRRTAQYPTSSAQYEDSWIVVNDTLGTNGLSVRPEDLAGPSCLSTKANPFEDWLLFQESWADMILADSERFPEVEFSNAVSSNLDESSDRDKKSVTRIRDIDWSQFSDDEVTNVVRAFSEHYSSHDSAIEISDGSGVTDDSKHPNCNGDIINGKVKVSENPLVNKGSPPSNSSFSNPEASGLSHQRRNQIPPVCLARKMEITEFHQLYLDHIKTLELQKQFICEEEESSQIGAECTRTRECIVCGESKEPLEFPATAPTSSCAHPSNTCSKCLQSWMASEFDTKGCDGIKCPECPETLDYNDIRKAASPQTFDAYDQMSTRNVLSNLPEFAWCLAVGCNSGQLNTANGNYMDCANCGYKQCLTHKVPWHFNETCDQYEYRTSGQQARDEEAQTEAMIDSVSKKCPGSNCGWRIQKTDGCDHMTCRKCRHQFCWQCLASHADIKRLGNIAHQGWCKFHSDQLSVAWPFNAHQ